MLKFKINNSNANFSYENIETDSMTFSENANSINVSVKSDGHNLMANDAVRLVCIGGDHYYEEVNITVIDDDNFCFDKSQYIDMDILNIEKSYVDYLISDGTLEVSGTTYGVSDISYKETLVINLSSPHYCWVGKKLIQYLRYWIIIILKIQVLIPLKDVMAIIYFLMVLFIRQQ